MRDENIRRKKTAANTRKRPADSAHRSVVKEKKARMRKLFAMVFVFLACFVYLSYKIIDIKLINGDEFEAKAITQLVNGSMQSEQTINPLRGSIVDRNMQGLAVSARVFKVYIDPRKLVNDPTEIPQWQYNPETGKDEKIMVINPKTGKEEQLKISIKEESLQKLKQALDYSDERMAEIEGYLTIVDTERNEKGEVTKNIPAEDTSYKIIEQELSAEKAAALEELAPAHIYLEADSKRNYINGSYAASVVGFVRGETAMGLEKQYNEWLAGKPGRSFRVYSNEGFVETEKIDAEDGGTVVTTIDLTIQKIAEDAALKYGELYDAKNTSVIVMNPKTAELYAMASYPSFDLNNVMDINGVTKSKYRDEWKNLSDEELALQMDSVWRNFNIYGAFEPGSIFKPITVAAALEEGVVAPGTTFTCTGGKEVGGMEIGCNAVHGTINLQQAVAESCNVAMMDIASWMGPDLFYKYQKDFGFGEKTGIDLPYEREDTDVLMHALEAIGSTELATASFGQRFNATTLQDITSFAAVVNGGNLMKPYIVSQVLDADGNLVHENTPTTVRKVVSASTSDYLRQAMEATVSDGTGWRAKIDGWAIGGKTGTGEQGVKDTADYHYSLDFITYFPVENPEYIVMVAIDYPAEYIEGETSPGPMIKEVMQNIIKYKSIPPTYEAGAMENLYDGVEMTTVGSYVGRPLNETISELNRLSLGFELMGGNGTVVSSQFPADGTQIEKGKNVLLTVSNGEGVELTTVPNLVGLTQLQAEEMLTAIDLAPYTEIIAEDAPATLPGEPAEAPPADEPPEEPDPSVTSGEDYVVEIQMPEAEKQLAAGTEVKIKLRKIAAANAAPPEDPPIG